jgi:alkylation response protein AidB-like acyl-CoA dehydrogenase
MNLDLPADYLQIRDAIRDVVKSEVIPHSGAWDHEAAFPSAAIEILGELGMLGILVPERYGGSELDTRALAIVMEEIARGDGALALSIGVHNTLSVLSILDFASEEQRQDLLPRMAQGRCLGTYGARQGDAEQESAEVGVSAQATSEGWELTGTHDFVPIASAAQVFVVEAKSDSDIKLFLLDRQSCDVSTSEIQVLGMRAAGIGSLSLNALRLPSEAGLNADAAALETIQAKGWVMLAALALGLGRASLEAASRYALDRKQFGKPIAKFQAIQHKLADMAIGLEGARLLTYRAASSLDAGRASAHQAAMAKNFASEAAFLAADQGIQIHGGYGYTREYPVERYWRDAKLTKLLWGSSSMMRDRVARQVFSAYD